MSRREKPLWKQPRVQSTHASPVAWVTPERPASSMHGAAGHLLDPKPARSMGRSLRLRLHPRHLRRVHGLRGGTDEAGLVAYKLADKPQLVWTYPSRTSTPAPSSTMIRLCRGERGRALCVELATGKVAWEGKLPRASPSCPVPSSPTASSSSSRPLVYLVKAAPDAFTSSPKANSAPPSGPPPPSCFYCQN